MADAPLVLDSVTQLGAGASGAVALCASHGGIYAAWYAVRRGVSGLLLHDAGVGRDAAGVGGLPWLDRFGVPAAAVAHSSARIGDGADIWRRGVLSVVNAAAARRGLAPGMSASAALALLADAQLLPAPAVPEMTEARQLLADGPVRVIALDSNGLVSAADAGHIIVTGSHGGLLGGRPETAVKADVAAAIYNDAGIGIDQAGTTRLPALDSRGIAGATVDAFSARIGDALSTWNDGIISALNRTAAQRGGRLGQTTRDLVAALQQHSRRDAPP